MSLSRSRPKTRPSSLNAKNGNSDTKSISVLARISCPPLSAMWCSPAVRPSPFHRPTTVCSATVKAAQNRQNTAVLYKLL